MEGSAEKRNRRKNTKVICGIGIICAQINRLRIYRWIANANPIPLFWRWEAFVRCRPIRPHFPPPPWKCQYGFTNGISLPPPSSFSCIIESPNLGRRRVYGQAVCQQIGLIPGAAFTGSCFWTGCIYTRRGISCGIRHEPRPDWPIDPTTFSQLRPLAEWNLHTVTWLNNWPAVRGSSEKLHSAINPGRRARFGLHYKKKEEEENPTSYLFKKHSLL